MAQHPNHRWPRAEADDLVHGPNGLDVSARAVLWCLVRHVNRKTGECWPSHDRVAACTGLTDRTVKRTCLKLRSLRLLTWTSTRVGQRQGSNRYTLNLEPLRALVASGEADWKARREGEKVACDDTPQGDTMSPSEEALRVTEQGSQGDIGDVSGGQACPSQGDTMSLDSPDLNLLKEHPDRTTRASAREPVSVEWVLQKFGEGLERFNGRPYRPSDFNRTEARDRKQAAELLRVLREDGKVAEGDLRSCLDRILSGYLRQDEQWLNENGHPLAALTRKVLEPRGWLSDWQSMQEAIEATKRLQEERAAENAKNAAEKARRAALTPEERAAEDAERQAMTDAFLASLQKRGPARRPNYGMGRQDQLTEEDAEWLRAPETR